LPLFHYLPLKSFLFEGEDGGDRVKKGGDGMAEMERMKINKINDLRGKWRGWRGWRR